jgi:hypothetical protein
MKPISTALEQAERARRYRQYHWCRRPNGFSDMPMWRVVAQYAQVPLYQVLALVNRLEELANNAANFGDERGSVATFDPDEFGAALVMPTEEAARIFAALEHEKVRWIEERTVRTFHDRNPDREEDREDVRNRKRRSRSRQRVRESLARLSRTGKVSDKERLSIEVTLKGLADGDLVELQVRLARLEQVTQSQSDRCDIVTVTPDQTTNFDQGRKPVPSEPVAPTPIGTNVTPIDPSVFADGSRALQWLKGDGAALVAHRLGGLRHKADDQVQRWSTTLCNDSLGLAGAIYSALATQACGDAFRKLVENQVARRATELIAPVLPLGPVQVGKG